MGIGVAAILALSNPSKEDYASWATHRVKDANGDSVLASLFFAATGNALLIHTTARKNFLLFSVFETDALEKKISSIGILSSFIPLTDSKTAALAQSPDRQVATRSSNTNVAKVPIDGAKSSTPSFSFKYSSNGVPRPVGIYGVADLMSAPIDPDALCFSNVDTGVIEQVEYSRGTMIPESFKLRRSDGFLDQAVIDSSETKKISEVDLPWLNQLIAPKRSVFIISYRCGAAGRIINVRDIFDLEYIRAAVTK